MAGKAKKTFVALFTKHVYDKIQDGVDGDQTSLAWQTAVKVVGDNKVYGTYPDKPGPNPGDNTVYLVTNGPVDNDKLKPLFDAFVGVMGEGLDLDLVPNVAWDAIPDLKPFATDEERGGLNIYKFAFKTKAAATESKSDKPATMTAAIEQATKPVDSKVESKEHATGHAHVGKENKHEGGKPAAAS
jgi:hypothetical protein